MTMDLVRSEVLISELAAAGADEQLAGVTLGELLVQLQRQAPPADVNESLVEAPPASKQLLMFTE